MREIFNTLSVYWSILAFIVTAVFAVFGLIFALCLSSLPVFFIWILDFILFFPASVCWMLKELEKFSDKE